MPNESAQMMPPAPVPVSGHVAATIVVGSAPAGASTQTWKCTISSSAPLLGDTGAGLEIAVIDTATELRSANFSVDSWRPPKETTSSDGTTGWERDGAISLPAAMVPGAVLVRKAGDKSSPSMDYIGSIELVSAKSVQYIIANSWVSSEHGWRVFFTGKAYLPKDTPVSLTDERQRELEGLRGTPETRVQERKGADRIYWYQEYSDLSAGKKDGLVRPNLGGSKELPYPRRLATNRGNEPDDREKPPAKGEKLWLQLDEQFSFDKKADFDGAALQGGLTAAFTLIAEAANQKHSSPINLVPSALIGILRQLVGAILPGAEKPLDNFEDFADVMALFKEDADAGGDAFTSLLPSKLYPPEASAHGKAAPDSHDKAKPFKAANGAWDFRLPEKQAAEIDTFTAEKRMGPVFDSATGEPVAGARTGDAKPDASDPKARLGKKAWKKAKGKNNSINELLYYTVPKVLAGRPDAWHTDEEFGRQTLAGVNPCLITALKALPESVGSAIRPEHVNAELQGFTMEGLIAEAAAGAKPRLFLIDCWDLSAFWEAAAADRAATDSGKQLVQHAGRGVFYLRKDEHGNDNGLIPVAIELAHPDTHKEHPELAKSAGVVYSRAELVKDPHTLVVWRLAKAVFKSLDSVYHQLVSHFTRTHCALEPFFIAMRRQISTMHPVFKLMAPHFHYTLNINRDARSSLINAGGIIERTLAGPYGMRFASVVYGKSWNLTTEALPTDLISRGMVDANGKPWMDYPYADDGMDIWNTTSSYFDKYLHLYYKDDQEVVMDPELQAWWNEVKNEGHPDLVKFGIRSEEKVWGFTGPIPSIAKLTHVLTTMAWLASSHHAAVNFGQYDYSSLPLNTSSLIRKPIPAPGQKAYTELTNAAPGTAQEKIIMTYLSDPITAATIATTVKLLSSHARDEHTLDEVNTQLVDPKARAANQDYIEAMKQLEVNFEMRNANPANWTRYGLQGGTDSPLPYTLLMPASQAGVTMRGVPYSVSI